MPVSHSSCFSYSDMTVDAFVFIVVIVFVFVVVVVYRKPTTFATLEMDGKKKLIFALPGERLHPAPYACDAVIDCIILHGVF